MSSAGVDPRARPAFGAARFSPGDALNDVFSGPGAVQAVGTVGIGGIYQVTPNFSMGIEARAPSQQRQRFVGWPC